MQTEVYDGPLALLLFLIRQQGVDIRDLRIAPITDAYLAHLHLVNALDLDHAGEFLVMAATLCFLKSRELLPRNPLFDEDEEEDDPEALREALIQRLQEYRRYREAADQLSLRPWLDRDTFAAVPRPVTGADQPVDPGVDALGLAQIYHDLLQRHATPDPVHEVERESYSIEEMAGWLLQKLDAGPRELHDLMRDHERRTERVLAFFATLELARLQMIDIQQDHHLGPVILRALVGVEEADLQRLTGDAG